MPGGQPGAGSAGARRSLPALRRIQSPDAGEEADLPSRMLRLPSPCLPELSQSQALPSLVDVPRRCSCRPRGGQRRLGTGREKCGVGPEGAQRLSISPPPVLPFRGGWRGVSDTNPAEFGSGWGLGRWEGGGQSRLVRVGTDK